ncbi:MAG: uracil permease, partial [Chloroflexi bacterium]|nr:uracil permease [Chloroflexota bacterium]
MAAAVALGLQHVLVSNVWLDPVFVAAAAGLALPLAANLVNAIFLAAGIVTLLQSTRLVRLPVVEGPSAAFDGLMIGFGKAGQLAMATT